MECEPLASLVEAQRLGTLRSEMPMFVGQNMGDDLVAARGTVRVQQEWCGMGVPVQSLNLEVPQILPKTALGHVIGLVTVFPALQWLKDRFDGIPAPSNCWIHGSVALGTRQALPASYASAIVRQPSATVSRPRGVCVAMSNNASR